MQRLNLLEKGIGGTYLGPETSLKSEILPLLAVAGASAAAGMYGAYKQGQAQNADRRRMENAVNNFQQQSQGNLAAYKMQSQNNLANYTAGLDRYQNNQASLNQWLNPNTDYQLGQIAKQNNQQYGAQGTLNSGAAMRSLQNRTQDFAQSNYNNAFNQMNISNQQGIANQNNLYNAAQSQDDNNFNAQQGIYQNALAGQMGTPDQVDQFGNMMSNIGNAGMNFASLMSMRG